MHNFDHTCFISTSCKKYEFVVLVTPTKDDIHTYTKKLKISTLSLSHATNTHIHAAVSRCSRTATQEYACNKINTYIHTHTYARAMIEVLNAGVCIRTYIHTYIHTYTHTCRPCDA
jgi:hypothetical protein